MHGPKQETRFSDDRECPNPKRDPMPHLNLPKGTHTDMHSVTYMASWLFSAGCFVGVGREAWLFACKKGRRRLRVLRPFRTTAAAVDSCATGGSIQEQLLTQPAAIHSPSDYTNRQEGLVIASSPRRSVGRRGILLLSSS